MVIKPHPLLSLFKIIFSKGTNLAHGYTQVVQEKLCCFFHNPLQPIPRLKFAARDFVSYQSMRVYSDSYWLAIFVHNSPVTLSRESRKILKII